MRVLAISLAALLIDGAITASIPHTVHGVRQILLPE